MMSHMQNCRAGCLQFHSDALISINADTYWRCQMNIDHPLKFGRLQLSIKFDVSESLIRILVQTTGLQ
jgi:hypothetical protein